MRVRDEPVRALAIVFARYVHPFEGAHLQEELVQQRLGHVLGQIGAEERSLFVVTTHFAGGWKTGSRVDKQERRNMPVAACRTAFEGAMELGAMLFCL